jgi:L-fuconolactonase
MYGSDWPVCLQAGEYDEVAGAMRDLTDQLSAGEQEQLFGGTATDWYGLTTWG